MNLAFHAGWYSREYCSCWERGEWIDTHNYANAPHVYNRYKYTYHIYIKSINEMHITCSIIWSHYEGVDLFNCFVWSLWKQGADVWKSTEKFTENADQIRNCGKQRFGKAQRCTVSRSSCKIWYHLRWQDIKIMTSTITIVYITGKAKKCSIRGLIESRSKGIIHRTNITLPKKSYTFMWRNWSNWRLVLIVSHP